MIANMATESLDATEPVVSVVVPARNEEVSLGLCLESLVGQQGVSFEVIVVDDESTDGTRAIAEGFSGVRVVDSQPLRAGWSGKANAMRSGALEARGAWLLFTDADTVHLPGSLARAVVEAKRHGAALLSYSPEQEVHGLWQKAVMPVIFAELAASYRPAMVNDPASSAAAANGQYLLITREAYAAVGGQTGIMTSLLEDVALAKAVKASGRKLFFRYGAEAVRTRMYRSFGQLREGWTKNLALLFPSAGRLALLRLLEFVLIAASACVAVELCVRGRNVAGTAAGILCLALYSLFYRRIRKAHFSSLANALAVIGLPVFSCLLWRSRGFHQRGNILWKGRMYPAIAGGRSSFASGRQKAGAPSPWST
jgi:GT2 family glycosyltransferase